MHRSLMMGATMRSSDYRKGYDEAGKVIKIKIAPDHQSQEKIRDKDYEKRTSKNLKTIYIYSFFCPKKQKYIYIFIYIYPHIYPPI